MKFGLLVISILLFCYLVPFTANAGVGVTVTTDIIPDSQEVDVSPGSTGAVLFSGYCNGTSIMGGDITVSLMASVTPVGSAAVSPSSFTLTSSHPSQSLSISVVVPLYTPSNEEITVTITGTYGHWTGGGSVESSQATITVLQYYRMTNYCETPYKNTTQGENVNYNLKIENLGNGNDTFALSISNLDELESKNVTINFDSDFIDIPIKQNRTAILKVNTSKNTPVGLSIIELSVSSVGSDGLVNEPYPLYLRVKEAPDVSNQTEDTGENNRDLSSMDTLLKSKELILGLLIVFIIIVALAGFIKKGSKKSTDPP